MIENPSPCWARSGRGASSCLSVSGVIFGAGAFGFPWANPDGPGCLENFSLYGCSIRKNNRVNNSTILTYGHYFVFFQIQIRRSTR